MQQICDNIKLVRVQHKGKRAPDSPEPGALWLRTDVSSRGILQMHTGAGFSSIEPFIGFTPGQNLLDNGGLELWRQQHLPLRSFFFPSNEWQYFADGWAFRTVGDDSITVDRGTFTPGQTEVPGEPRYYASFERSFFGDSPETLKNYRIEARMPDLRRAAGRPMTFSCWLRCSQPISVAFAARSYYGSTLAGNSPEFTLDGTDIDITSKWQRYERSFILPSLEEVAMDDTAYFAARLRPIDTALYTLYLAKAKLEAFPVATAFANERPSDTQRRASTRFYKSYDLNTAPGDIQQDPLDNSLRTVAMANGNFCFTVPFNPNLTRFSTTSIGVTVFNPGETFLEGQAWNLTTSASVAVKVTTVTTAFVCIEPQSLDANNANSVICLQLSADADLH
jgi:hypothetical protein